MRETEMMEQAVEIEYFGGLYIFTMKDASMISFYTPRNFEAMLPAAIQFGACLVPVMDIGRAFIDQEVKTRDRIDQEFKLLVELASNNGKVLSREDLLERVWGYDYFGDSRLVDVHVRRLRTKVEIDPANPKYVVTVRGMGYKLQTQFSPDLEGVRGCSWVQNALESLAWNDGTGHLSISFYILCHILS